MPETTFAVRWPDGVEQTYYSPSLVVHDHLEPGATYEVAELVRRTRAAMTEASDRVRAKYGMPCTRARATLAAVEGNAARHPPDGTVAVVGGDGRAPADL